MDTRTLCRRRNARPRRGGRRGSDEWTQPLWDFFARGYGAAEADAALMNGHFPVIVPTGNQIGAAEADAALMNGHGYREDVERTFFPAAEADAALMNGHLNQRRNQSRISKPRRPTRL